MFEREMDPNPPTIGRSRSSTPIGQFLLSLPNELLEHIARAVAPNGGRRAGTLRLVCRHLDRIVTPITWSSLHLAPVAAIQRTVIGALTRDRDGCAASVQSVRCDLAAGTVDACTALFASLPHLSRLHVFGESTGPDLSLLPLQLWNALPGFPQLQSVVLERLDLEALPTGRPSVPPL